MPLTRTMLLALGLSAFACGDTRAAEESAGALMSFDTARIRIVTKTDTLPIVAELAKSPAQHTMGLMERTQLADSAGMLFIYGDDQPATSAFWMFRTKIPLDIAFISANGVIGSIKKMVPCATATAAQCPNYPADVAYRAALEMNAGWFEKHRVVVGDRVMLADTLKK